MKPATTFTALRTPFLNPDGTMTWTWQQWFIDIQNRVQNALGEQGQFEGNISASATVGNRPEPLSVDIHNIDDNGVITANGIDFTRAYLNKNTDNIGDGSGSPLAGGKTAYAALVASAPTAGELLGYDGMEWTPQQKAHSLAKITSKWLDSYSDVTGNFTQSQPAFSDLSGTLTPSQLPTPTTTTLGGVKSAGPAAHSWLNAIDTTGTPLLSQPAFSDISGTAQVNQGGTGVSTANANQVFAGPSSGPSATPSFRSLVNADMPALPVSFQAALSSIISNATGDGTEYTVIFDTAFYNIGSAYNATNGVFTAPQSGKYMFSASVMIASLSSGHTIGWVDLAQSNASFSAAYCSNLNPFAVQRSDGYCGLSLPSTILKLNTGDTVSLKVHVQGGAKTVSVVGFSPVSSGIYTFFNGIYLSS